MVDCFSWQPRIITIKIKKMHSSLWLIKELSVCHTSTLGNYNKLSFLFHWSLQCLLFNAPLWLQSYASCFDDYSCALYPLLCRDVYSATLCDKVCQWHAADRWFYPGGGIKLVVWTQTHFSFQSPKKHHTRVLKTCIIFQLT